MAFETKITESLNKKSWIIPVLFGVMCSLFIAVIVFFGLRGTASAAATLDNLDSKFAFSIGGEFLAILVAIVLTASILPAYKRQSGYVRIFVTLLTVGCFVCFLDICQMLVDGMPELILLNKTICVLVFASETVFTFFFWVYITYVLKAEAKMMGILSLVATFLLAIFVLLPFVNFFYPLYFYIDANGVYHRDPETWWLCRVFISVIVLFVIVSLFLSKEKKRTKIIILIFMGVPIIAIGAGGWQYGVSILYSAMMVSLVLVYALLFSDNEKHLYSTNKELGLATKIQMHMLPSIFPAFPERKEFDVYALMNPAKEVGGDFYDFFLIDETHLGLVMADVSDKGVPAALFMMASKIMVQNYALMGYSPKEVLTRVNRQICTNNQDEMFVTIWFGVLDLKTGVLTASNGGHEKPIIKRPGGHFEIINDKHNLVVGFFPNAPYSEYKIQLEKGSKIFVYTDGIPECRDKNGQFGMERTLSTIQKYEDKSPTEICKNTLADVLEFMGQNDQFDDITMLCVEYQGYDDDIIRLKFPADVEKIYLGIDPIINSLKEVGVLHADSYKIEVALEELLVNIASYAYAPETGDIEIEYEIKDSPRSVIIKIMDEGKPFDPLQAKDPDTTLPEDERQIGGLGIFIVKNTMDEIEYHRIDDKNVLIIKKKI
ncbi:MAG: SpoIIE family protein phosphatase [Bacilli bacterium]|nr:SpoIIE family protein phosphatase [Bacilli bacterium]